MVIKRRKDILDTRRFKRLRKMKDYCILILKCKRLLPSTYGFILVLISI